MFSRHDSEIKFLYNDDNKTTCSANKKYELLFRLIIWDALFR